MTAYKDYLLIQQLRLQYFEQYTSTPLYNILLINGEGTIFIDAVSFDFSGKIALFTTPYQQLKISGESCIPVEKLAFHGDFYCIEYHKQEVACNGLLFNNIYQQPFIYLPDDELQHIFTKLLLETEKKQAFTEPILKSYLQLVLAIASRIKKTVQDIPDEDNGSPVAGFQQLLEQHFLSQRSPLFYANELGLPANSFTKYCTKHFGKSPSKLIQERVVLEAKKQLHLTHQSSKEIAALMNFDDQHYFSRYFKNHTGVSPSQFRAEVGISIVADLSIN
ncbi:helix-turn-helix domain-containing protein [Pedobacter heparinus]|uniref:helix-turn-helix domain-containing protein n=1 Tax=Pedobacter heparinus TaxID=984 RepID=UPI0029315521|nr:helix-turn-helix domain-containing protein [Pedobacter heparinus]